MASTLPTANVAGAEHQPWAPQVAILTGGADKPYALGLASCLLAERVAFDFVGSSCVDGPDLHGNPFVRFLNLRGDQDPNAGLARKVRRLLVYYVRLFGYALVSRAPVFHVLWNNKWEQLDRTLVMLFYRLRGKRVVFTAHNVNVRKRDGHDTWLNRLTLRIQYRLVSHIFVHTEQMQRELIDEFAVRARKISVIPFGMNNTVPDTDLTPGQARARLGLFPEQKVVLFFGNIAPYKGLELLVAAAVQLKDDLPGLRLIIAGRPKGETEYWAAVKEQIDSAGLTGQVISRIEYVPDGETEVYFKAADVLALPYRHIFQSGVLFLGYNFGLPVIASDVGCLKEDVVEGQTGLICRPGDATDLARCIRQYFASEVFLNLSTKRHEIRTYAQRRHSWEIVGERTRRVYSSLAQGSLMGDDDRHSPVNCGAGY